MLKQIFALCKYGLSKIFQENTAGKRQKRNHHTARQRSDRL